VPFDKINVKLHADGVEDEVADVAVEERPDGSLKLITINQARVELVLCMK
jgi:hypothetical protein